MSTLPVKAWNVAIHPAMRLQVFDELDDEADEAALRLIVECLIHLFEGYMSVCCPAVGIDDAYLCGPEILMFRIVLLEEIDESAG